VERTYTVIIERDREAGSYWARVPALPGCFTQGDSVSEVMEHAREAIAGHLTALKAIGQPIPEGDAAADEEPIRVTVTVAA
jgi:predicted RNase H-like HicB family nuclease